MERNLYAYSIMRLSVDDDKILDVCEDIKNQYESGVTSCPLFLMSLVPEGNPVKNKPQILTDKYLKFKKILDEMGVPSGILVQSLLGHGWVLGEHPPYQLHVGMQDGKEYDVLCPLDEGFKRYVYDALVTLAKANPKTIMIDDDLRILTKPGKGCLCPLHLKKLNEVLGENLTREEFVEIISKNDEKAKRYLNAFQKMEHATVVDIAKIIRQAIDDVNPDITCSDCGGGSYNAGQALDLVSALTGKGHPSIFRLNNGRYCVNTNRVFSYSSQRAAHYIQKLKGKIDLILAEADTCPHNRYGTSASELHTQYTLSIIEGCAGAKHWLTRGPYEPEAGLGYRKILAKHANFYEQLYLDVKDGIDWQGCKIYFSPRFDMSSVSENSGWAYCALESLGLPLFYSCDESKGVSCLEGYEHKNYQLYTDDEIIKILSNDCFLDSKIAEYFIERGFGKYLGVDVVEHDGSPVKGEICTNETVAMSKQANLKKLIVINDDVKVDSYIYNSIDEGATKDYLFPGVTVYKNELGGNIVVFAGTPSTKRTYHSGMSYLSQTRKNQLIRLLSSFNKLPAYYTGDVDVYLKAGYLKNGELLVSLVDMNADEIENLQLYIDGNVKKIKMLTPSGEKKEVAFTKNGNIYDLDLTVYTLKPVILYIEK